LRVISKCGKVYEDCFESLKVTPRKIIAITSGYV